MKRTERGCFLELFGLEAGPGPFNYFIGTLSIQKLNGLADRAFWSNKLQEGESYGMFQPGAGHYPKSAFAADGDEYRSSVTEAVLLIRNYKEILATKKFLKSTGDLEIHLDRVYEKKMLFKKTIGYEGMLYEYDFENYNDSRPMQVFYDCEKHRPHYKFQSLYLPIEMTGTRQLRINESIFSIALDYKVVHFKR